MEETIDEIWMRSKAILLSSISVQEERLQAEGYFSMISRLSQEDGTLVFHTVNTMSAEFLKEKFSEKILYSLHLAGSKNITAIDFRHDSKIDNKIFIPEAEHQVKKENTASNTAKSTFISTIPLDENYTFEEFVQGPSNSWAFAAAKGVANNPGMKSYNPLFIHGGTGLGKTHLMQAIGNELNKKNPKLAVCYITAETFLNEYVNALQKKGMESFREKYRYIDVLLVDDIQFLQKGKMCQEEFFNTFNHLTNNKKQIVMTCDVAPKNLPALEERLISRFEGGLVQEIEAPGLETRLAILRKKAENMSPKIPDSALSFIAEHIKSHVRAMEGALSKVHVSISFSKDQQITPQFLSFLLKDLIEKEQSLKRMGIIDIQEAVSKKFGISLDQIKSKERTENLVTPRQLAMFISRIYAAKSLPEIAESFNKTTATIIHGVKSIEKRLDVEPQLKVSLEEILAEFGKNTEDKLK